MARLAKSKRGLSTITQVTSVIPLSGARVIPTQPTSSSVQGLATGVAGSIVSVAIGAPGYGSVFIQGLPRGLVELETAISSLVFTCTDANITQTFSGVYSIGTTATASATLTGTAANVIASTSISAATAGISPLVNAVNPTIELAVSNVDSAGTTGTKIVLGQPTVASPTGTTSVTTKVSPGLGLYLNLALSTVATAAVNVTVTGQITINSSISGNY